MINLKSLDEHLNEASSSFKHAVQQAIKAAGYNLKQSEVKVGAKKVRGMGTKITLNGEMIGFDDNIPEMIASFTKSIQEDPEKYGLKESINEAVPSVEDYHTKDKRDILFTIEGPHKKSLQTSRAIYKDVEKHGIIFDEFFDNDKGNESGKFLISFPASVNNVQAAGKKEIIKLVGNRGTLVERPNWVNESVNELKASPRSDKAIKDLEKQGSEINYLDDADPATKKLWKKAGINPDDQNTIILYSYVAHPWEDVKNILTKHSINFKELEDPNSAGESMITFIEESVNEAKSNIKKKWASTAIMMDDLKEFINDAKGAGGEGLVRDIHDTLRLMTNYAKGEIKESVNEAEIGGYYLMKQLKDMADDIKRDEPKTAAALTYLHDRIDQSARDIDLNADDINDFLNEPRGRKHSQNLPEWMITDLFVESFIMKEEAVNEGEILVWEEMGKPFEDLKNALDKIGKENTDPKWSKGILNIWNMIEKAEDKLNLYDKMYGAIPIKESVNERKVPPNDETIKFHIDSYRVDDDPYDVAKEIGSQYNWTEKEIERAEKILRKKYLK